MRWLELSLEECLNWDYTRVQMVRAFKNCFVLSATWEGRPVLLLDEFTQRRFTVCEYDDWQEREEDISRLLQNPPGGGPAGAVVPAWPRPTPPARTAQDAKPLPESESILP